jgi:hypothetical protein
MSAYYTVRYQLANGQWSWMENSLGQPHQFPSLEAGTTGAEKTVSLDYVIEGLLYDDQGLIVGQWVADIYRSQARRVETMRSPVPGEPESSQESS